MTHKVTLPLTLSAPAEARAFVASNLPVDGDRRNDAMLATSELVTNALLHSGASEVTVEIRSEPVWVRISHTGTSFNKGSPSTSGSGGRGLLIVEQVAARWGRDVTGERVEVWFEV